MDDGAKGDFAGAGSDLLDNSRAAQALFELGDLLLELGLLVLGVVVFSVLGDVTKIACLSNPFRNFATADG